MTEQTKLTSLTADIVASMVANNKVSGGELPTLIAGVHAALSGLGKEQEAEPAKPAPAVSIRSSVKPEYLVCLECGKRQVMLKRHLDTAHKETPQEYRAKFGLPADYPMIASNYAEQRRGIARVIGLGRKMAETVAGVVVEAVTPSSPSDAPAAPRRGGRPAKAAATEQPNALVGTARSETPASEFATGAPTEPKKRGRKPKSSAETAPTPEPSAEAPKRRGRKPEGSKPAAKKARRALEDEFYDPAQHSD